MVLVDTVCDRRIAVPLPVYHSTCSTALCKRFQLVQRWQILRTPHLALYLQLLPATQISCCTTREANRARWKHYPRRIGSCFWGAQVPASELSTRTRHRKAYVELGYPFGEAMSLFQPSGYPFLEVVWNAVGDSSICRKKTPFCIRCRLLVCQR